MSNHLWTGEDAFEKDIYVLKPVQKKMRLKAKTDRAITTTPAGNTEAKNNTFIFIYTLGKIHKQLAISQHPFSFNSLYLRYKL